MNLRTKTKISRNRYNISILAFGLGCLLLVLFKSSWFSMEVNKDFHKDIITLASIFGGFSFTTYGILIGLSSQKTMIQMEKRGYTSPYYLSIIISMIFIMISLLLSFAGLFISPLKTHNIWAMLEIITFLMGVLFFIASIMNVMAIQREIRKDIKKSLI